jgi:hypothetical protein
MALPVCEKDEMRTPENALRMLPSKMFDDAFLASFDSSAFRLSSAHCVAASPLMHQAANTTACSLSRLLYSTCLMKPPDFLALK